MSEFPKTAPAFNENDPYSSFTVHIFLSHDPFIASMLLPELFADFPTSKWILPPTAEVPVRVKDGQSPEDVLKHLSFRETLGRYVMPASISASTSLQSLLTFFAKEFQIDSEKLAQFTIFPQSNTAALWHDEPLPWNLSLSQIAEFDKEALRDASRQLRVLHLVLETKAATLARSAGDGFDYSKASVFQLRDSWSAYTSFWHMNQKLRPVGFVTNLTVYREIKRKSADSLWRDDDIPNDGDLPQLKASFESVRKDISSGKYRANFLGHMAEDHMDKLSRQIRYLEIPMEAKARRLLITYAHQWEEWVIKKNYASSSSAKFRSENIDNRTTAILQQILDRTAAWNESPDHKLLQAAVEEEYYASRPWMSMEERAQDKERLLKPANLTI
jgi:hypothetical protein